MEDKKAAQNPEPERKTQRYQVQVQAVIVGSKDSGEKAQVSKEAFIRALADALEDGRIPLQAKEFSSGSAGFFAQGKVEVKR